MHSPFSHSPAFIHSVEHPDLSALFHSELSQIYTLGQRSEHIFGSPLGPFYAQSRHHHLPRFVYFGEYASRESVHLAIHAGFDARDLRGSLALLRLIEHLALEPAMGQGLQLSLFPLVDVLGLAAPRGGKRPLATPWTQDLTSEITLLKQDAHQNRYHGFIRIEPASIDDAILIRQQGAAFLLPESRTEKIPNDLEETVPVVWETDNTPSWNMPSTAPAASRPPFELVIGVPGHWGPGLFRDSVNAVLRHLISRFRGVQAYAPHI